MKKLKLLIAITLCLSCQKEEANDYTIVEADLISAESTSVSKTGDSAQEEIVAKNAIINHSTSPVELRWIRETKVVPSNWEMAVCDTNACYFPSVDSADFELEALGSARLWAYFYPEGEKGEGESQIRVFPINDRANAITIRYSATAN